MLETITEKIIFTSCIICIVLAIATTAYLSLFSERSYVYYQGEVMKVVKAPSILESDRRTVVVKLEDGTLKEFTGNSAIFLLVKEGDIVKVRCYLKQIYQLYSIEGN